MGSACTELAGWSAVDWDARLSAGNYATLAALLAGFSLSGLFWISSTEKSERLTRASSVLGVYASLVPLVVATLLFGELSGELDCARSALAAPPASLLLTVGAVGVFVSLGQLLQRVFDDEADKIARTVSWTALVLGTSSIYQGNATLMTLVEGSGWETSGWGLVQLAAIGGSLVVAMLWRPAFGGSRLFVYTILLSALVFVLSTVIAFQDAVEPWMSHAVAWTRIVLWAPFALLAACVIRTSLPKMDPMDMESTEG